ncbi:MAG: hypothetical protein AAF560_03565 [Acidobacteriota bacterium]
MVGSNISNPLSSWQSITIDTTLFFQEEGGGTAHSTAAARVQALHRLHRWVH